MLPEGLSIMDVALARHGGWEASCLAPWPGAAATGGSDPTLRSTCTNGAGAVPLRPTPDLANVLGNLENRLKRVTLR